MGFTTIEITGTFKDASGKAIPSGKVVATLERAMQLEDQMVEATPINGIITNGTLKLSLFASDMAEQLPQNMYYRFKIEVPRATTREWRAIVPHAAVGGKIDITELEQKSGTIPAKGEKPQLYINPVNNQTIVEALGALGLVEIYYHKESELNEKGG